MSSLVSFFILAMAAAANAQPRVAHLTYSNAWYPEATTFQYQTWEDRPDLAATWKYYPDEMVGDICYHGIWALFADRENYYTDIFDTFVGVDECAQIAAPHKLGSARLVGVIGQSRLNLYSSAGLMGNATVLTSNQTVLDVKFESFILVGPTQVQLYEGVFYTGKSYCVQADGGWPFPYFTRINNITDTVGVQPGGIRSIRFGCTAGPEVPILAQQANHPIFTRKAAARVVQ